MIRPAIARFLLAAPAVLLLSGCIAFGSIDNRATNINRGVGDAQNRALLLNLARASRFEPLYFLTMTRVTGSAQEDFKVGLPAVILGPDSLAGRNNYTFGGAATNILDNQTLTSFDVSVLGSKDFYAGLLTPLGLDDVNLLFSQGFSRDLVLYLVVDRLTVTDVTDLPPGADDASAHTDVFYNDPTNEQNYAGFERFIGEAMTHGLTTEPEPYLSPAGGGGEAAKPDKGSASVGRAQLCYDWALATEAAKKDFPSTESRCGASATAQATTHDKTSKLAVNLYGRKLEIDVKTRSIFGIFTYLGGLIAHDEQNRVRLHHYALPAETTVDAPVLNVVASGEVGGDCFTALTYAKRRYCVPEDGSDNTKKIFNILNALLALKTSQGDLPITQTVRITP